MSRGFIEVERFYDSHRKKPDTHLYALSYFYTLFGVYVATYPIAKPVANLSFLNFTTPLVI